MRHFFVVLLLSFLVNDCLLAQGGVAGTNTMPNINSPVGVSPNAASLGKFGEIPVGYYTGIPNIGVPLYEINSGGLKVPISLDYHAGGVKVEDIASWAGIGWALNAGGVITRQVRGIPDDGPGGYLYTYDSITKYMYATLSNGPLQFFSDVSQGLTDSQQDLFFFNFGGGSGKFMLDSTGAVITIPSSRYKIEFGSFLGQSQAFKITDLSGNQYFFTSKETTTYGFSVNNVLSQTAYDATSSWYLSRIINALNTDSITFSYGHYINNTQNLGTQTQYVPNNLDGFCSPKTDVGTGSNLISALRLASIQFKNGTISFVTNSLSRCDLTSERSLNSIIIQNTDSSFYKKYTFYQSFTSTNFNGCDSVHPDRARLYVDSLSFSDNTNTTGTYRFSYINRQALPSRLSYSQDQWGYFNGANNPSTMVPSTFLLNTIYGASYVTSGANRNVDFNNAPAGTLNTIVYPTGGRTEFQYEANTVSNLTISNSTSAGNGYFQVNPYSPFSQRILDTSFVLNEHYQGQNGAPMTWTINPGAGCSGPQMIGCPVTTLTDTTGIIAGPIRTNGSLFVNNGRVRVKVDFSTVQDSTIIQNYVFALSWPITASSVDSIRQDVPVGGLRIKTITNYTADNTIASVKQYDYNVPDSVHYSSGILLSLPTYGGAVTIVSPDASNQIHYCPFITISSTPCGTMTADQGSYVTYKYVQELLGQNGEFGKNEYQFTAADEYPDIISDRFPFPPATSAEYKRGKLVHENNYRYNGASGQYEKIKETINKYQDVFVGQYYNLKVGMKTVYKLTINTLLSDYAVNPFANDLGWFRLVNDTTRIYDQNSLGKFEQTSNIYTYSDVHYQPITIATTNSKGETRVTQNKYPLDYAGLTGTDNFTKGIKNLQDRNIVTPVIEKYTQLQNPDGTNNRTLNGVVTSYRTDKPLPDTIWSTEFSSPSISFSPTTVSGGKIVKSGSYLPQVELLRYDPTGNIIEQRKNNDASRSYIWDYHGAYPVAEVVNADSTSIAYTSFEADGSGNWTIGAGTLSTSGGVTGNNYYTLSSGSTITKSGLNATKNYLVTYWSKNGPLAISGTTATTGMAKLGWTFYQHVLPSGSTSVSISGNGKTVDELRLYPSDAQMTTYTYNPLIGQSSACTINNAITYYQYDGIGRLRNIKDMDGNVIKTYEYHYKQ